MKTCTQNGGQAFYGKQPQHFQNVSIDTGVKELRKHEKLQYWLKKKNKKK